jgi:hypothetical protein
MPAIKSTTPPASGGINKSASKKVISPPPMQSVGPMHKHTGFIIAIVITVLLLIGSGVLAYITWSNGEALKSQITNLTSNSQQIAQERDKINGDLESALMDLENAPKPSPFFYTSYAATDVGEEVATTLHSLTSDGDVEIFTTSGPGSTTYSVYAMPRVGFDGRIWLDENADTDSPSIQLREFDTVLGTELTPAVFADFIPQPDATRLSPDETRIATVYSRDNSIRPDLAGQVVVWNLLSGDMVSIGTLEANEHFSDLLDGFEYFGVSWKDNNCVRSDVYSDSVPEEGVEQTRVWSGSREFCIE